MKTPIIEVNAMTEAELMSQLLERLDDRLKNAHYWMTESVAIQQSREAILEARGTLLRIREKLQPA